MIELPYRCKVKSCIRKHAYKYFLFPDSASTIWRQLQEEFGPDSHIELFNIRQINREDVLLRYLKRDATITVIEKTDLSSPVRKVLGDLFGFVTQTRI